MALVHTTQQAHTAVSVELLVKALQVVPAPQTLVLTTQTSPTSLTLASTQIVTVAQTLVLQATALTLAPAQHTVLLVLTAPTLPTS